MGTEEFIQEWEETTTKTSSVKKVCKIDCTIQLIVH